MDRTLYNDDMDFDKIMANAPPAFKSKVTGEAGKSDDQFDDGSDGSTDNSTEGDFEDASNDWSRNITITLLTAFTDE